MEVHILLFLTSVAVISVSGQFSDYEYRLDSVPFPIRRRLSNAKYELQPSLSREIEYQDVETTRSPSQGRRHIGDNQRLNIQNEQHVTHDVNNFGTRTHENKEFAIPPPADRQPNHNRGQHVGDDQQLNAQVRQQKQQNRFKGSSIEHVNRNGEINPTFHEAVLKTNPQNTQSFPSQDTSTQQRNYESLDNARTNVSPTNQQSGTRVIDNSRQSESSARTNANNRNVVKPSQDSQDSYNQQNYPSDDSRRTSEPPTNPQTERREPSGTRGISANGSKKNMMTNTPTLRSIDNDYRNRQSVDPTRTNNNRNNEGNVYNQNTESRTKYDNRNVNNRPTTEPTRRNTIEDRAVTSGSKSTQDNELESRVHPDGRSRSPGTNGDDKWIWNDATALTTTLPEVDDRAAFAGDKCPTGQVRFNNKCINTDS